MSQGREAIAFLIVPGLMIMAYSLATTGSLFRLSIDFTGGSIYDLTFTAPGANEENIRSVFAGVGDPQHQQD